MIERNNMLAEKPRRDYDTPGERKVNTFIVTGILSNKNYACYSWYTS